MTNTYIAYVPLTDQTGAHGAVSAAGQTVGVALREAASQMNAIMAAGEGYPKNGDEPNLIMIVVEVPSEVKAVRHYNDGDKFRAVLVNDDDTDGDALRVIFAGALNPLKIVDGRFQI